MYVTEMGMSGKFIYGVDQSTGYVYRKVINPGVWSRASKVPEPLQEKYNFLMINANEYWFNKYKEDHGYDK